MTNYFNLEEFINEAVIVSKTDSNGKIIYANKKFVDISGYPLEEILGKDHNIVNSGEHSNEIWSGMYEKTIKQKGIWNMIVTNRSKNGELYYVDTFIKAMFDTDGKLSGFMSIRQDVTDIIKSSVEIEKKNSYLEHAAKILRHDMHSGINTYIPRGISSLERRLSEEQIKTLKIESPLKMLKDGLKHTQKVYKGVYEFTNLVKKDVFLHKEICDVESILNNYLLLTAYKSQVTIEPLLNLEVNEPLFCTAIDNLIRNGLKYNDSLTKFVRIYFEKERKQFGLSKKYIVIQDNGRGMSQEEFNYLSKPYVRKDGQKEGGTGLGLNICVAILNEHKFSMTCEKNSIGTKIKIKIK